MTVSDLAVADAIGAEAGWPGRRARYDFFVRHPCCLALAAELEGEMVGMGFGTRNGAVGWLGLICVSPRFQRRGIGLALTSHVAERLEEAGCRTLVLTATEAGKPVYEKLGFFTETFYHEFSGPGLDSEALEPAVRRMLPVDLPSVCDLDLRLTGEDRSHLLRAFQGSGWLVTGDDGDVLGYHLPAPWGGGPVIAEASTTARALLHLVRTLAGSDVTARFWLATENEDGREYMNSIGFGEERRLPRMIRGEPVLWSPKSLWGLFSLAKG
jgi:GNAT superfamily N-acetyltransferase